MRYRVLSALVVWPLEVSRRSRRRGYDLLPLEFRMTLSIPLRLQLLFQFLFQLPLEFLFQLPLEFLL